MKAKKKVSHPGKIGKVGPKIKPEGEKKVKIQMYLRKKEVDKLGGEDALKEMFMEYFENNLKKD